jgi:hypothetical protein
MRLQDLDQRGVEVPVGAFTEKLVDWRKRRVIGKQDWLSWASRISVEWTLASGAGS